MNCAMNSSHLQVCVSRRLHAAGMTAAAFVVVISFVCGMCMFLRMPFMVMGSGEGEEAEVSSLTLAKRMAATAIALWNPTGPGKDQFQYELGVLLRGMELLWRLTGDPNYFHFLKFKVDRFVNVVGNGSSSSNSVSIRTYNLTQFSLDNILTGRILLTLYDTTHEHKYRQAAALLRKQLKEQPRTKEGGFWHKLIYPFQMWLDGLYMAEPFYAQYAKQLSFLDQQEEEEEQAPHAEDFNDIALQFKLMFKHARDPKTGLLYHGYDESRKQKWSNPITGDSPSFWARGVGWYCIGLVDTLDFFPSDHPHRAELLSILHQVTIAVKKVQDPETGLWWEVLDKGGEAGNYLESSAACMFVYTFAKGARKGYLPPEFCQYAHESYSSIVSHFISPSTTTVAGGVDLNGTVSVAGLGGIPYRNGTYAYYVSQEVVTNDPKGVGAFLMASIEIAKTPRLCSAD